MADIRKGSKADIILQDERYSYNSMLEWYSYKDWFDGKGAEWSLNFDIAGYLHDVIYNNGFILAIYDYVDRTGKGKGATCLEQNLCCSGVVKGCRRKGN